MDYLYIYHGYSVGTAFSPPKILSGSCNPQCSLSGKSSSVNVCGQHTKILLPSRPHSELCKNIRCFSDIGFIRRLYNERHCGKGIQVPLQLSGVLHENSKRKQTILMSLSTKLLKLEIFLNFMI